jgi:hypothetical protein
VQTIGQDPEERSGGGSESGRGAEVESAADLDDYLNELNSGKAGISGSESGSGSGSDSGDGVDVTEYMKETNEDPEPLAKG